MWNANRSDANERKNAGFLALVTKSITMQCAKLHSNNFEKANFNRY